MKHWNWKLPVLGMLFISAAWSSCRKEAVWDTTPYVLEYGGLPDPILPSDNPITVEGVKLGRMLFYDTRLSGDGTQACASCHQQEHGFSDPDRFSTGIEGLQGRRQAMSIVNLAWNTNHFFWDGRAELLRHQSLMPIQDPLEMNETLENVRKKMDKERDYRDQFTRAFGDDEITDERISFALEQFMFTLVSYRSKYDLYLSGEATLTASEERGRLLFFTEYNPFFPNVSGADCQHCHSGLNFENDQYMNNGLDTDAEFTDLGYAEVTGQATDNAKFKVPSLRNIEKTAPYMHDGRFQTLEEVVDHYNSHIDSSSTVAIELENTRATGLMLDAQKKADLVAFLKTLTDEAYLTNPAFAKPE